MSKVIDNSSPIIPTKKPADGKKSLTHNVFSAELSTQNKNNEKWVDFSTDEIRVGDEIMNSTLQERNDDSQSVNDAHSGLLTSINSRRREANSQLCALMVAPLGVDWVKNRLLRHTGQSIATFMAWCIAVVQFVDKTSRGLNTDARDLTQEDFLEFLQRDTHYNSIMRVILGVRASHKGNRNNPDKVQHPAIVKFTASMVANDRKQSTISTTVSHLPQFFEWLCRVYVEFNAYDSGNIPVWQITVEHLRGYRRHLEHLVERGQLTDVTVDWYFKRIKTFFNFCYRARLISRHPMDGVKDLSSTPEEVVLPSQVELNRFFEVILRYSDQPLIDFTAFTGLLLTGLRIKELASLKWTDIDLRVALARVRRKGDKIHQLPLPRYFLDCISLIDSQREGYVFGNNPDSFASYMYYRYRAYELLAGWQRRTGVHIFRHMYVTGLTHGGYDIRSIMFLTGHESSIILQKYIHRSDIELRNAVNTIRWRTDSNDD